MVRTQLKFAYSLSMVIAFLLTVASASGLFIADFYRDNTLVAAALRGNDLVSLVVAVPLFSFLPAWLTKSTIAVAGNVRVHALQLCVLPVWGSIQSIVSNLRHALLAIDFCAHLWATESGYLWN